MKMYFILPRAAESLHKTNTTVLNSLSDQAHFPSTLCLWHGLRKLSKGTGVASSLIPYNSASFFSHRSGWLLTQGSERNKKGYRAPWSFTFLRRPELSFCLQIRFCFKWKGWPLGMVSAPLCRGPDSLPLDQEDSCWFHHGSPRVLCLWGTLNAKCQWGFEEQWTHISCVCSAHTHVIAIGAHTHVIAVGLCLENPSSKLRMH